jgi:hypothetical protein
MAGALAVQLMSPTPTTTPIPVAAFVASITTVGWLAFKFARPRDADKAPPAHTGSVINKQ